MSEEIKGYCKVDISDIGDSCVGCGACEQICPQNCITMVPNYEGFLYPEINSNYCVGCGLCLKVCAQLHDRETARHPSAVYALKNKNTKEIFNSASGGAADVVSKVILERGGAVFGAAYTEDLKVKHICIRQDKDRCLLQSSKYVQSDINSCYIFAEELLKQNITVLFTGTPCQIDGLYHFLGKDYDNLYTLDLICHGVPSPLFFKKYIDYLGDKMGEKVIAYNFRSKEKRGWGTQYLAKTKTKTKTKTMSLDKFGKHFMNGDCYRECCYNCRYANTNRPADLTVGDFWGLMKNHSEFFSKLGVSLVLVNTKKGEELMDCISNECELLSCSLNDALIDQGSLIRPAKRPGERDEFYSKIEADDFIKDLKVGLSLKERLKAFLPASLTRKLKQFRTLI